jgi:N-acetyl-beta-hexosaminidase
VSRDGILIVCENKVGLAWALATLRQLLARWFQNKVCVAVIVDRPQLAHRGVLLDVARNFVPLSQISDLLLTMAAVKLNVLHLHLTDDQVRSLSFFAPVSLQLTLRLTPIRLSHSPVHHAQNSRLPTL